MEQNDNRESQRAMAIVCLPFVVLRQLSPLFFFSKRSLIFDLIKYKVIWALQ